MAIDLDTIRTRIAVRDAYWKAVAALETTDVKAFFDTILDAHVALYGVSYLLKGYPSWHFNPHEVPSILERLGLDVNEFKLTRACPYGSCLSLDASFDYRGYPLYVSAFFAYRL